MNKTEALNERQENMSTPMNQKNGHTQLYRQRSWPLQHEPNKEKKKNILTLSNQIYNYKKHIILSEKQNQI